MKKQKQILDIKVLPGEATNGSGKICIHLFVRDTKGSFTEPGHLFRSVKTSEPTRGRIACNRKLIPTSPHKGISSVLMRTDSPQAVTCLKCKATSEYLELMSKQPQQV